MNTISLEDIKIEYAHLVYFGLVECDFEHFLQEKYVQTYDINLNFIGYEIK